MTEFLFARLEDVQLPQGGLTGQILQATTGNTPTWTSTPTVDSIAFTGGGAFKTIGANVLNLTTTGPTNITAPVSGTLATLAGNEALTNKTINGNTWTAGTGVLTLGAGKTATISNTLTFTGTDASSIAFGTGGTVVYTANNLSVFAATTSAQLGGILSDETGSGGLAVFNNGPTLIAPVLGAATATSINKVTITAPGTSAVLTIPNGVTLTGPASSGTAMTLGNAETVLGVKTFGTAGNVGQLVVAGSGSGSTVIAAAAAASGTMSLPAATSIIVGTDIAQTLTNKTMVGSSNTLSAIALSSLAAQAAFSLVGNNTSGAAVPGAVDIALLTTKASPAGTDLLLLSDQAASGAWKKVTVSSVAAGATVSSIAGNTGAFTLSTGITNSVNDIRLNRGHLPGETTTGAAAAGEMGEYVETVVVSGSAISPTSGTAANVATLSIPSGGDWDVSGTINYKGGASTTVNFIFAGITLVSATLDITPGRYTPAPVVPNSTFFAGSNEASVVIPPYRISVSGATSVFLITQHSYAVSTMSAYGLIRARRVR